MQNKSFLTRTQALNDDSKILGSTMLNKKRILKKKSSGKDEVELMMVAKLQDSRSTWRKSCFSLRRSMIVNQFKNTMFTLITGFLVVLPCIVTFILIFQKFYQDHQRVLDRNVIDKQNLLYSHSIIPLMVLSGSICALLIVNNFTLVKDILTFGPFVWIRNSLGDSFCDMIMHICIFISTCKLYNYIHIKEKNKWQLDVSNDNLMDFYDVFRPIQVLIWIYLFKELMIKSSYGMMKVIMALSALWIAIIVNSYFDSDLNNDAQLWILAIPISIVLFCQAYIDFHFYFYNPDSK